MLVGTLNARFPDQRTTTVSLAQFLPTSMLGALRRRNQLKAEARVLANTIKMPYRLNNFKIKQVHVGVRHTSFNRLFRIVSAAVERSGVGLGL
jgi:hypothetical protein